MGEVKVDNRKDILLLLLYQEEQKGDYMIEGRTRLMKLLYLLGVERGIDQKLGISNWYKFLPYNYGPFSKHVFDDIDFLENLGFIRSIEKGRQTRAEAWEDTHLMEEAGVVDDEVDIDASFEQEAFSLTEKGRQFVRDKLLEAENLSDDALEDIRDVREKYGNLTLSSLLRYVYTSYPQSAEESELAHLRG